MRRGVNPEQALAFMPGSRRVDSLRKSWFGAGDIQAVQFPWMPVARGNERGRWNILVSKSPEDLLKMLREKVSVKKG